MIRHLCELMPNGEPRNQDLYMFVKGYFSMPPNMRKWEALPPPCFRRPLSSREQSICRFVSLLTRHKGLNELDGGVASPLILVMVCRAYEVLIALPSLLQLLQLDTEQHGSPNVSIMTN